VHLIIIQKCHPN